MRTTERLLLRPFQDSDLPAWADLNADPEVTQYLGSPLTREQSDHLATAINDQYAAEGFSFLAIERRSDGTFLGAGGLSREPWHPNDLEVGWRLARQYWGHGYATEMAESWLDHAFTTLNLPRVLATTDAPNTNSIAVMTRLGMTFDRATELEEDGQKFEAVVYSITREVWRGR